jgi:hypothetical protein
MTRRKVPKVNPRHIAIANMYASGKYMTSKIASWYHITPKSVQRIAKKHGVLRTRAESNKLMAPYKDYSGLRVPPELKVLRGI